MHSVHLPFQSNKVYRLHMILTRNYVPYNQQIRIILLNLDFKIGNGRQSERLYLTTWGEFFFSFTYFFLITTRIRDFLLDIDSAYNSFVLTAAIGLEISGCNNISSVSGPYSAIDPSSNNKTLNARLLARVITGCHYT